MEALTFLRMKFVKSNSIKNEKKVVSNETTFYVYYAK